VGGRDCGSVAGRAARLQAGERACHLKPRAVNPALRSRNRDVEHSGHVLVRPSLDVAEDERRTSVERKSAQRGEEPGDFLALAGGDIGSQRPHRRRFRTDATLELGGVLERQRDEPTPPVALERLVDGNPVEPRERRRLAAEAIEVQPRPNERVLCRLLYVSLVVEEAGENAANPTLEGPDEFGERVQVAFSRAYEQRPLRMLHREDATRARFASLRRRGRSSIQEFVSTLLFAINGSCGETAGSMSAYAEGELTGYRRWRVARHLARCEKCQALYRSLLSTLESLRGLGRENPPAEPDFPSRVVERLRRESGDGAV
jgi:hypothetical protein